MGLAVMNKTTSVPLEINPEVLVPRLGDQLVDMGLLTGEQLGQALAYQREQISRGKPRLLGQTLVELEFIERAVLDRAVTEQIIRLRSALQDANRNLEERVLERTAELEEALRKLSELTQLKANFISNISHELRTPLTHIRGYLELLHTESLGALNDEQKQSLGVSLRSVDRLQNLIDDLILFSMASKGELYLKLSPVDLNLLIARILTSANPKAVERGVTLQLELDPSLPPAQADGEKLSWVLSQLLDNAIKFTPAGGSVTLQVLRDESVITLKVCDTGIGIPAERVKEIFEPFHQLDSSATRRYGGTGLGLSLVRQIIEAHGSLISVDTVPGDGTVVSFPLLLVNSPVEGSVSS
jgi:two-component system, sensor histidine kinase and response regulator